jgi:aminoglycoside phosphotransferase (APT) family kinase protein
VRALRAVPLDGTEVRAGRRPLRELDASTRGHLAEVGEPFDRGALEAAWDRALAAPPWDGAPSWIHADLLQPNLLLRGGQLAAVLDFGGAGAGDPATDLVAAWAVFGPDGRAAYRQALGPSDGEWERGRGIALHQAAAIVPYYRETNPGFAALGRRTIEQVLTG